MKIKFFKLVPWKTFRRDSLPRRAVALLAAFSFTLNVLANPAGMTVQRGRATSSTSGAQLTVNAGNNAVLNWQSFNIAAGETTTFNQPSAGSIVWNRIGGQSASQIYGTLQANGVVILLNSSGFYFGPDSYVSTAGLVVSTANCLPPQNSGGSWEFNGPPPLASIVNYGTIKIGDHGSAFLIADKVENHGTIEAPGGSIGLAAGQTVLLSDRPDGRGMSMKVTLPQGSVDNYGNLVADAGTIALNAKVVNQNGLIQANSVQNQNGVIELVASDSLHLGANSQMLAQGDSSAGGSAGGSVTLQSENNFSDTAGSQISVAGGSQGGNGGSVEISAENVGVIQSQLNGAAQAGSTGGTMLLDPTDLTLDSSSLNPYAGFASILFQASGTINFNAGTTWNLSTSTGETTGALTLEAGGNIVLNNGTLITDANNWSVSLAAGYNFINNASTPGSGSVLFNGSSAIKTAAGGINLLAGQNITVGSGYVITTGGGSINAHALAGNIDTGSDAQGYQFVNGASTIAAAYNLGTGNNIKLGGISTAAGGDVNLTAGGNVTSILPANKGYYYDGNFVSANTTSFATAGAGAYGSQLGNVNIVAGGNVTGNYLVANGTGSIFAGVQMDANGNPVKDASGHYVLGATGSAGTSQLSPNLALNLISGGWNVTAAQNIILQEVRNPNGVFNITGAASMKHYFDYAPDDYVNLTAGNLVQLGATSSALPRVDSLREPVIYPGILNINAGAGGVILKGDSFFNQLILFPSPEGSLTINTTGGGSLVDNLPATGGSPQVFNLIVSDSGKQQYQTFGDFGLNDYASTPVHLGATTPVELNLSGDMNLVTLVSPEAAQINVVGNLNNSGFQGMNLNASDVTSITVGQAAKLNMEGQGILNPATDGGLTVGGDINNRSSFTSVNLSQVAGAAAPDFSYLLQALSSSPSAAQLAASFFYNPATQILTYQTIPGVNLATLLQQLQNLTVQVYKNGIPQWSDPPYNTVPLTTTVSVINATTAQALLAEYNALGPIPAGNLGYTIGGGGQFDITARNMDLGTTPGIQSEGVGYYQTGAGFPLASLFTQGAAINVNLTGDLNMYSSSIASLNGGDISLFAGGSVNAGSSDFSINSAGARGIYTADHGNVNVIAAGDINVNGSRIAAYDGGNVTVESLNGNVDAGSGGSGFVIVYDYSVNPVTHQVTTDSSTIPGSGILATTFPSDAGQTVGNILVETPNGNINASAGGVVQLPLNNTKSSDAVVQLLAGLELRDVNGNILSAADIAQPTLQGDLVAAATGDLPQTVVIQNGSTSVKLQVSAAIWSQLAASLNLSPAANQNLELNLLGGESAALQTALSGNGSGLANYNYAAFASANRNIDATGSGVIGQNVVLKATGEIKGVFFSPNNINIHGGQIGPTTALGPTISAFGPAVGPVELIGTTRVNYTGSGDPTILSQDANGAGSSLGQGTTANAVSQAMSNQNLAQATQTDNSTNEDDPLKKKGIALAQKVSRVTVLLPEAKKLSEKSTANNPL
jgi:filamentous hemagglutinin family protein